MGRSGGFISAAQNDGCNLALHDDFGPPHDSAAVGRPLVALGIGLWAVACRTVHFEYQRSAPGWRKDDTRAPPPSSRFAINRL